MHLDDAPSPAEIHTLIVANGAYDEDDLRPPIVQVVRELRVRSAARSRVKVRVMGHPEGSRER